MLALTAAASLALSLGGPKVKVVFTDCDGTMLTPDHVLSPAASKMLHTLADAGVRVVPATGRARAGAVATSVAASIATCVRSSSALAKSSPQIAQR